MRNIPRPTVGATGADPQDASKTVEAPYNDRDSGRLENIGRPAGAVRPNRGGRQRLRRTNHGACFDRPCDDSGSGLIRYFARSGLFQVIAVAQARGLRRRRLRLCESQTRGVPSVCSVNHV